MLVDDVTITVKAGDGGNGSVHFRRNAQTAKGGPDGGNGGNGGNVYFQGINDVLGLRQFQFKKRVTAENGIKGAGQNLFGRNGEDLIVRIPIGTLITDVKSGKTFEVLDDTTKIFVVKGGKGGKGNNEFKSATNQTPLYAEKGEPGEEKVLHCKLRLIADIGFIGLPNAGKSTLLALLTNAKPKIGNYPFTTLEPNLGVMIVNDKRIEQHVTLADIPGLIEGASKGKGLGTKFLRHVEKTKMLVHCVSCQNDNVIETYNTVRNELSQYSQELLQKPEIILLTKTDLVDEKIKETKQSELKKLKKNIYTMSIYNNEDLETIRKTLTELLAKENS